jgi:RNase P/RNase MRP subunit p30
MANDLNFIELKDSICLKKISSKSEITPKERAGGYLINTDEEETRKIISFINNKNIQKIVAITARDENFNRRVLETLSFDYLISPEVNIGKDSLKQRSSGLNHVLTRLASKKKIGIVISLNELFKLKEKEQSKIISKIIQNIKLCRKDRCAIKIANLSDKNLIDKQERKKIGTSWGMSSQQARDCIIFK